MFAHRHVTWCQRAGGEPVVECVDGGERAGPDGNSLSFGNVLPNSDSFRKAGIVKHVQTVSSKHPHLQFKARSEYARDVAISTNQCAYYMALDAHQRYRRACQNANMAAALALLNASRGLPDAHGCSAAAATTAATCGRCAMSMTDRFVTAMVSEMPRTTDTDVALIRRWDECLFREQGKYPQSFGPLPVGGPGMQGSPDVDCC